MRRNIIFIAIAFVAVCSCRKADELPPLNEGYATTIVLPDGVNLTKEERDYLEELDREYEESIKK